MENGTATHDAIADVRDWLRRRDAHRTELRKELEVAKARVAEIEALLTELGGDEPPASATPRETESRRRRVANAKSATIPDLVLTAVRGKSGMTVAEIVEAVQELRAGTDRTVIYPAVYRMAKETDGRLRKRGDKYHAAEAEGGTR